MEFEVKYILPNFKRDLVIDFIASQCVPDPDFSAARISSIYYDSREHSSLNEKINSDFHKTKYRLRWYSNYINKNLSKHAFMEKKSRIGGLRNKKRISVNISPEILSNISLNDFRLLEIPNELLKQSTRVNWHLFPSIQIDYSRFRFIEQQSGARISIDFDIFSNKFNSIQFYCLMPRQVN